jgi:hypothetical protein
MRVAAAGGTHVRGKAEVRRSTIAAPDALLSYNYMQQLSKFTQQQE